MLLLDDKFSHMQHIITLQAQPLLRTLCRSDTIWHIFHNAMSMAQAATDFLMKLKVLQPLSEAVTAG